MHALLVTFHSSATVEDLQAPFTDYAATLRSIPGLISKTWLKDGETLGGFHVFTDRALADRYLASEMVAALTANDAFDNFAIVRYDVLSDLSITTGTPADPITAAIPGR